MKFLSVLLVSISIFASSHSEVEAFPNRGKLIVAPHPLRYTGLKQIPDHRHPYRAPGRHDQRGPCTGLNTLANHGYLPRNGIVSFEEIVNAVQEGFNLDYTLGSAITAFGILSRGNALTNQISIGGTSAFVPPLPHNIDYGNAPKGLSGHGRFEGDVSMTRYDAAIGDHVHFSQTLYDELLDDIAIHGDDSDVTGPKSLVSWKAITEFKYKRFVQSQANNPTLQYHYRRYFLSYSSAPFSMFGFANGTDGTLSVPSLTSFLRDEKFPPNWSRHPGAINVTLISDGVAGIINAHPVSPGQNVDGVYVPDTEVPNDCSLYTALASEELPRSLVHAHGLLKRNVDMLLNVIHDLFPHCERVLPSGEPGL